MVPTKTTTKKYTINQLFTRIAVSLLSQNKLLLFLSVLKKKKKIKSDKKIKQNKKIKINKPLSGSFANV